MSNHDIVYSQDKQSKKKKMSKEVIYDEDFDYFDIPSTAEVVGLTKRPSKELSGKEQFLVTLLNDWVERDLPYLSKEDQEQYVVAYIN